LVRIPSASDLKSVKSVAPSDNAWSSVNVFTDAPALFSKAGEALTTSARILEMPRETVG
jgi:hypothetical protein